MDAGCQAGTEEHRASLVFYVIVFTLLPDRGATPAVAGSRLLHELRACREQLERHLQTLLDDTVPLGPGSGSGAGVSRIRASASGGDPGRRLTVRGPE